MRNYKNVKKYQNKVERVCVDIIPTKQFIKWINMGFDQIVTHILAPGKFVVRKFYRQHNLSRYIESNVQVFNSFNFYYMYNYFTFSRVVCYNLNVLISYLKLIKNMLSFRSRFNLDTRFSQLLQSELTP